MGESLKIGDIGHIIFEVHRRDYYLSEGKMKYHIVKTPFDLEGMTITDVDSKWLWIEGMDKSLEEHFMVRRKLVRSFIHN